MKILVVSNMYPSIKYPSYGIFVKRFCDELDKVQFISYDKSVMKKNDTKIGKIIGYLLYYVRTMLQLLMVKYDVVYVHYASHSAIPILIMAKIKKFRIYTNVHGSDVVPENKKQRKMQKYTKKLLEISDRIIVPSEYFRKYVLKKYKINCEVKIYPSAGVNAEIFKRSDKNEILNFKRKNKINEEAMVFGVVGRISKNKGWDTFVKAIPYVINNKSNVHFIIVGDGIEKEQMKKLIEKEKVERYITQINLVPQEELALLYSSMDFFVFPTKRRGESLGLVALEAMACGVPVIASDFAAPGDYVINGHNGYKYNVGDAKALAAVINKCSTGQYNYEKLQSGAKSTAERYYVENIRLKFHEVISI